MISVVYGVEMALIIKIILLERKMTVKELAEKVGNSVNDLSNKVRNDNFEEKELRQIAQALNCDYDVIFTFKDSGKQL